MKIRKQIRSLGKRRKIAEKYMQPLYEVAKLMGYEGIGRVGWAADFKQWRAEREAKAQTPEPAPAPVAVQFIAPPEPPPAPETPQSRFSARIRQALVDARKIGPDATDRTIEGVVVHCFGKRALTMSERELWVYCDLEREHIQEHLARLRRR